MVMLLGQYSTGKTTFIKHLLRSNYPGKPYPLSVLYLQIVCAFSYAIAYLQELILDQSPLQIDLWLSWYNSILYILLSEDKVTM